MSIAFLKYSGGYNVGDPPLPIPNREVKPNGADGTASQWESRTPPFLRSVRERGGDRISPSSPEKKVKERVSNPRVSPFLFSLSKNSFCFSLYSSIPLSPFPAFSFPSSSFSFSAFILSRTQQRIIGHLLFLPLASRYSYKVSSI
mgnify:CR=1 FL=1